jgi:hypothetical protein
MYGILMTLVSHPHKFIFLKTHKTASTSVEMLLEPMCRPEGWTVEKRCHEAHSKLGIVGRRHGGKAIPFRLFNWRDHMAARSCRRALGRKRWNAYAKIATVRDPCDRILSSFFWNKLHVGVPNEDPASIIAKFRSYVLSEHWNDDRDIVELDGGFVVDHTIRFEHMRDDLANICASLSLPISVDDLPQSNRSANNERTIPKEDFFDAVTANIVQRRFSWVYDNFDYSPIILAAA